jgi:hypothetical protein
MLWATLLLPVGIFAGWLAGAAMSRRMVRSEVRRLESLIENRNGKPPARRLFLPAALLRPQPAPKPRNRSGGRSHAGNHHGSNRRRSRVPRQAGAHPRCAAGAYRAIQRMGATGPRIRSGIAQSGGRARAMKLRITVDQKTYEVDVEVAEDDRAPAGPRTPTSRRRPPRCHPVPPPPRAAAPESNVVEDKVCRSPVAGIVVRVNAQPASRSRPTIRCWCWKP